MMMPVARIAFRAFGVAGTGAMPNSLAKILGRAAGAAVGRLAGGSRHSYSKLNKSKGAEMALAAAGRTALSLGSDLYSKPGVNANIHYYLDSSEKPSDTTAAQQAAELIVQHLGASQPERIGVDGLPGSGKSTLARALAGQMGMEWVCLDHQLYTSARIDLSRTGVVYEHHRLFRTQNLDEFDVLVYLDEPLETVTRQILNRGRAAAMLDVFDFAQMQAVGRKAFEIAAEKAWRVPRTNILVKRRPEAGFQEQKRLEKLLSARGIFQNRDLPKEALLFLATYGEAKDGSLAYLQVDGLLKELVGTAVKEVARQVSR